QVEIRIVRPDRVGRVEGRITRRIGRAATGGSSGQTYDTGPARCRKDARARRLPDKHGLRVESGVLVVRVREADIRLPLRTDAHLDEVAQCAVAVLLADQGEHRAVVYEVFAG